MGNGMDPILMKRAIVHAMMALRECPRERVTADALADAAERVCAGDEELAVATLAVLTACVC